MKTNINLNIIMLKARQWCLGAYQNNCSEHTDNSNDKDQSQSQVLESIRRLMTKIRFKIIIKKKKTQRLGSAEI